MRGPVFCNADPRSWNLLLCVGHSCVLQGPGVPIGPTGSTAPFECVDRYVLLAAAYPVTQGEVPAACLTTGIRSGIVADSTFRSPRPCQGRWASPDSSGPVINRAPSEWWQQPAPVSFDTAHERQVPHETSRPCGCDASFEWRFLNSSTGLPRVPVGLSLFQVAPVARREHGIDWSLVACHTSHFAVTRPRVRTGSGAVVRQFTVRCGLLANLPAHRNRCFRRAVPSIMPWPVCQ